MTDVDDLSDKRDVSSYGHWSVSSYKQGFGVDQLQSDSFEHYWQSDGPQPHLLTIKFPRRIPIQQISLYLDFKQDESYTPSRLSIRSGTSFQDLHELKLIDLDEPSGWINVPIQEDPDTESSKPLKTQLLQIAVLANHQNGKDTHIRQIKIFGPPLRSIFEVEGFPAFSSVEFQMHSTIR
ncbi:anaphase-promoting complex, subunit 10/DOC domain-containing protein [Polychytrium aggregatum]|uniref:anaphase-promoting complex, subunit 10/DOC domain-containing protein n=1 Tax=Polychytrium aggregatum TaxID=110093 RepID=UPI0022FE5D7D|nr:anaphase-promoting complex, subunit 10/DOC domain-containing protein [Polychytrium aggregatum]KAI9202715.1 anaphase-promoting complex, subunit 10/DOC domain-containing protein [Polychytrium aggregatum]